MDDEQSINFCCLSCQGINGSESVLGELSIDIGNLCFSHGQPHPWHDIHTGDLLRVPLLNTEFLRVIFHLLFGFMYRSLLIISVLKECYVKNGVLSLHVGWRS